MRPCSSMEAVARALSIIGKGGSYQLGTGDYAPHTDQRGHVYDLPWTERRDADGNRLVGSDCAGFAISWCYKLVRHRPGFNVGPWASVSDDLNCNSAIENADHGGADKLFQRIDRPELGCLLTYPTIVIRGSRFIGHVVIVTSLSRCAEWDPLVRDYSALDVAECHGPNGHVPGVVASTGAGFHGHDRVWPKPEHRTVMLRVLP